jgi:hypothetical protein
VLPEKVPGGGLIILRDRDPGEPEQALGGFANTYYQHAIEIEVYIEEGDGAVRDTADLLPGDRRRARGQCCAGGLASDPVYMRSGGVLRKH